MTKLTLTLVSDGAKLANITAEIHDMAKLHEIKTELKKFFDDNNKCQNCGNGNCNGNCQNPVPMPPMPIVDQNYGK